eukprot:TRINITY_DN2105_c0_g3_i1.p1 TRINITY_DN2105_c0_g3~~TRINITY_DN2105_c0_g3_i1.p1  ORF type:complete len:565 (+),score=81.98 TRINITY_DN2105_c0_g3_i1:540-2234(+)
MGIKTRPRFGSFGEKLSPIDRLPDDLLFVIFKKVEVQDNHKKANFRAITRVSRRWSTIANLSRECLSITGFKATKMKAVLQRFNQLSSLNLGFLFDCSEDVLASVGANCANLQELQISDSYKQTGGGSGLAALARGCRALEVLSMHGYKGLDAPLLEIGNCCHNLKQLRLRSAPAMGDSVIVNIAAKCSKLEKLDLSFTEITDVALHAIGKGLTQLKHLDLKHCKRVTGEGIASVATGCLKLQVLHLGVVEVGDTGIIALGRHSKHLEELYLDYGWGKWGKLSQHAVSVLAKGCRQLKVLSLRGSKQVDDEVLQGLQQGCPSLTSLDLHACELVTDLGLQSVIKGCKKLENLVLSGTNVGANVIAVNEGLPRLTNLRLNGDLITDALLKTIAGTCKGLAELYMANCRNITDAGLEQLLTDCKGLKTLTAKSSPLITGMAFTSRSPTLENLNLSSCGITNEGLAAIVGNCTKVSFLSIPNCCQVSADAIITAVSSSPHLKELNIVGCLQVFKDQVLAVVKASRASLKTLRVSRPDSPQDEYTIDKKHGGWILPSWARAVPQPPSP